jgi:hypothetical protein
MTSLVRTVSPLLSPARDTVAIAEQKVANLQAQINKSTPITSLIFLAQASLLSVGCSPFLNSKATFEPLPSSVALPLGSINTWLPSIVFNNHVSINRLI